MSVLYRQLVLRQSRPARRPRPHFFGSLTVLTKRHRERAKRIRFAHSEISIVLIHCHDVRYYEASSILRAAKPRLLCICECTWRASIRSHKRLIRLRLNSVTRSAVSTCSVTPGSTTTFTRISCMQNGHFVKRVFAERSPITYYTGAQFGEYEYVCMPTRAHACKHSRIHPPTHGAYTHACMHSHFTVFPQLVPRSSVMGRSPVCLRRLNVQLKCRTKPM